MPNQQQRLRPSAAAAAVEYAAVGELSDSEAFSGPSSRPLLTTQRQSSVGSAGSGVVLETPPPEPSCVAFCLHFFLSKMSALCSYLSAAICAGKNDRDGDQLMRQQLAGHHARRSVSEVWGERLRSPEAVMMTASAGGEGASSSSCPPLPSPHPGTPAAAASSSRSPFGSAASVAAVHLLPSGGGGGSAALSVPAAAVNAEATTAAGSDREAAAEMREDAEVEGREAAGVPVSAREMLAAAIAAARTGAGGGSGSSAPRRRSRSPGAAVACGDASSFRSDGFDGTPEVIGASPMSLAQALAGSSGAAGDGQESQQQQLSSGGMRPQALSSLPPPPLASPALASSPREGRTVRGDPVAPSASDAEGDPQHRQQQRRQSPPTKQPQQEGVQAPSSPSSTAPAATAPGADAAQQQQGPALQQQSQQLLLSWEQQAKAKQAGLPTGRDAAPECPMCLEEFTDDDPAVPQVPCGHDFHLQCILQWAERSHQCPVCSRTLADI